MTVLGIGVDLLKISRFTSIIQRNGIQSSTINRLAVRILNPEFELPKFVEYQKTQDLNKAVKLLSGSWCVKEAIYKSLDEQDQLNFKMKDWYKYNTSRGSPQLGGSYLDKTPNETFLISISHDSDIITATVLRQSIKNEQE